jgi:hypothetical protein
MARAAPRAPRAAPRHRNAPAPAAAAVALAPRPRPLLLLLLAAAALAAAPRAAAQTYTAENLPGVKAYSAFAGGAGSVYAPYVYKPPPAGTAGCGGTCVPVAVAGSAEAGYWLTRGGRPYWIKCVAARRSAPQRARARVCGCGGALCGCCSAPCRARAPPPRRARAACAAARRACAPITRPRAAPARRGAAYARPAGAECASRASAPRTPLSSRHCPGVS